MTRTPLTTFAGVAVLCCPALGQVRLETGMESGRTLSYEVTESMTIEQRSAADADASVYKGDTAALLELTVGEVDDAGNARVTCVITSYKSRSEDPTGPTSVAFDMEKDADPAALAALEAILVDATIAFTVTGKGAITGLSGLEDFYAAAIQTPQATDQLFGFFRPDMLTELFAKLFSAEGGIGPHTQGDTWTDRRRVPLGSGGAIEVSTLCTLQIAQDELAAIAGVTSFELYVPRERAPSVPAVSLGQSDGQLLTRWDLGKGGLVSRVSNHTVRMDWNREAQGEETPGLRVVQTQRYESRITRK